MNEWTMQCLKMQQYSPNVLDFIVLLSQSVLEVRSQLSEGHVGRIEACLCLLVGVAGVGQLRGETVPLALKLMADRNKFLDLATQLPVLSLRLTQGLCKHLYTLCNTTPQCDTDDKTPISTHTIGESALRCPG